MCMLTRAYRACSAPLATVRPMQRTGTHSSTNRTATRRELRMHLRTHKTGCHSVATDAHKTRRHRPKWHDKTTSVRQPSTKTQCIPTKVGMISTCSSNSCMIDNGRPANDNNCFKFTIKLSYCTSSSAAVVLFSELCFTVLSLAELAAACTFVYGSRKVRSCSTSIGSRVRSVREQSEQIGRE
jgi:hypothetical protein